jgi:hypothetical protein
MYQTKILYEDAISKIKLGYSSIQICFKLRLL